LEGGEDGEFFCGLDATGAILAIRDATRSAEIMANTVIIRIAMQLLTGVIHFSIKNPCGWLLNVLNHSLSSLYMQGKRALAGSELMVDWQCGMFSNQ